jgi:uncharacterized protein (DUF433 family)
MTVTETRYEHIVLTDEHIPIIAGTTMKVIELVLEKQANGWSAEELHFQHPYLSPGQIYSALAYYFDHQAELDQDIQRRLEWVEELRSQTPETDLHARIRAYRAR